MAHIDLPEGIPGIVGPLTRYPETGQALSQLAQVLLRGDSTLTPGERELIAAYTSARNECVFCRNSHSAAARHLLDERAGVVDHVIQHGLDGAPISEKMKALLAIAGKVQIGGRLVTEGDVARAHTHGATDKEIHDTVLIAAAFCMYNRYVDGLATWTPDDDALYDQQGAMLATQGYLQ